MKSIIVGDIGGTNSRFASFAIAKDHKLIFNDEIWLETNNYNSFEELIKAAKLKEFPNHTSGPNDIVVAVPGPITGEDLLSFPNVKWGISTHEARKLYSSTSFTFINDFIAQAFGCLTEASADAIPIINTTKSQPGQHDLAVVGAGTGTGHGALKVHGKEYIPFPSEAGHAYFPFITKTEIAYKDFLAAKTGNKSPICDDVVSGQGLSSLHQFITGRELPPNEVATEIPPGSDTTCWFSRFYARACRNFSLTALASGGKLFISGGVAIRNPFLVDNDIFRNEFLEGADKIRLLHDLPVSLIRNERIGLYGAAYYAVVTGQGFKTARR